MLVSVDVDISVPDELVVGSIGGDVGGLPAVIGRVVGMLGGVGLCVERVVWVVGEAAYNK